jgi:EAL domain-containing protein (putative c-di-GMP-specific phosphodiesterase class I)
MAIPVLTIVDDDVDIANLFREVAENLGFQVNVYLDGREFLSNLHMSADIIMLDLMMPAMDGVEVIRKLAEKRVESPLILVSGYDKGVLHSAHELAQESRLNIIASLTKPIHVAHLNELLMELKNLKPAEVKQFSSVAESIDVNSLQEAIREQQLLLYYQPQINLADESLAGLEALVRWQHPELGLVYPNSFIKLAEDNGLIGELTAAVIKLAIEQGRQWLEQGIDAKVSVNVSAENIASLVLPEQLMNMVNMSRLDPSLLVLEVTESALMGELVTSLDILTRLRLKGFGLSIDDFGTGYSSLSQLHRVPFNELKIDQSFVMQMDKDAEARAIVETCVMLGHKLNMRVVAEGVESESILNKLKSMRCDIAQGYHIARPMAAEQVLQWLDSHRLGQPR